MFYAMDQKVIFLLLGSDLPHPPELSGKNILDNRPCQQHCTAIHVSHKFCITPGQGGDFT